MRSCKTIGNTASLQPASNTFYPMGTIIAFILPASFAKACMQRGIDPHFPLRRQIDLPGEPMETEDRVNCVFQVGERRREARALTGTPEVHPEAPGVPSVVPASGTVWTPGRRNADSFSRVVSRMPHSGELILEQVAELEKAHDVRPEPSGKPFEMLSPLAFVTPARHRKGCWIAC